MFSKNYYTNCNGLDRLICNNDNAEGCSHDEIAKMDNPFNSHKSDCSDNQNSPVAGLYSCILTQDFSRAVPPPWRAKF
jgi:hypothetical protein